MRWVLKRVQSLPAPHSVATREDNTSIIFWRSRGASYKSAVIILTRLDRGADGLIGASFLDNKKPHPF
jgi:hypothetical protein